MLVIRRTHYGTLWYEGKPCRFQQGQYKYEPIAGLFGFWLWRRTRAD